MLNATQYSIAGLAAAARHEDAFRQELILVVLLTPLALWLGDSGVERALMIGSLIFVLIVELLNSAVEATVDRISFEFVCRSWDSRLRTAAVRAALGTGARMTMNRCAAPLVGVVFT